MVEVEPIFAEKCLFNAYSRALEDIISVNYV